MPACYLTHSTSLPNSPSAFPKSKLDFELEADFSDASQLALDGAQ